MRPPICALCDERLSEDDDQGGLVSFARTESDQDWLRRSQAEPGFVGHPPWQEWFCGRHIEAARELQHLSRGQALRRIREQERTL